MWAIRGLKWSVWEVKREGLVVSLSSMSEAQRAASWLELQREKKTTRKIPQSEYLLRAITSASQKQGCKLHKKYHLKHLSETRVWKAVWWHVNYLVKDITTKTQKTCSQFCCAGPSRTLRRRWENGKDCNLVGNCAPTWGHSCFRITVFASVLKEQIMSFV